MNPTPEMSKIAREVLQVTGWKDGAGAVNCRALSLLLTKVYDSRRNAGPGTDESNGYPPAILLLHWLMHLGGHILYQSCSEDLDYKGCITEERVAKLTLEIAEAHPEPQTAPSAAGVTNGSSEGTEDRGERCGGCKRESLNPCTHEHLSHALTGNCLNYQPTDEHMKKHLVNEGRCGGCKQSGECDAEHMFEGTGKACGCFTMKSGCDYCDEVEGSEACEDCSPDEEER